ncbi:Por secretion system C-terminal sorting domain-containing protein [Chryseobacterium oleae]|uniref:Por secretion system C-terminal sorting domain-containing protein n=1 Tax=Chryseobacterium oleae TaxID=491207 RepID=A0A1I4Z0Q2_CHROL|nr:S8 family serine peptidase [Chryseobacterium oleae]SFN43633.1 Por secretion system C-terminal sorting domain-containing protein [Chryseobacterium oleae]
MKKKSILLGALLAAGITIAHAQTQEERANILKGTNVTVLEKLSQEYSVQFAREKSEALEFAKKNNIPVIINNRDGSMQELMKIVNGKPIYFTNNNVAAAKSTRANHLNSGGSLGLNLAGENIQVGVWDGDTVRMSHQEFGTRVTAGDNGNPNFSQLNRDHATHVSGTIAASGVNAAAKGMAPKSKIKSYDWNNDISEMAIDASQGLIISNHSYGNRPDLLEDWQFGAYTGYSSEYDRVLFNAPYYVVCKSAGNSGGSGYNASPVGGGSSRLFDNLSDGAVAKNTIVVANANDANINSAGNLVSVSINSSSSEGPTDDLRIKPDITGNGTELYSPVSSSNTAYESYTGTSMSSPNVTGTLVLVNEHFKNQTGNFMLGAALKGLALHTADDAGAAGPDVNFGWGLLNAKKMAETINNRTTTALISDKTLSAGGTETISVNADGVSPVIASISWYDRPGATQTSSSQLNSTTKRLVNDLDLRIVSSNGQTYYPWALTSRSTNNKQDNNSDNFERVDAGVLPAGQYSVVVTHKGTLTGGSQNYTLIVTGKSSGTTPVTPTCNVPTNLVSSNITTGGATLSWTASSSANTGYTVEYQSGSATNWTAAYTGTATTTTISGLTAGSSYTWRVKTNCSTTAASAYVSSNFTTVASPSTSCAQAYETNNTLAAAYGINTNTDYKAAIGTNGDLDYYKYTVAQGTYTVNLTELSHDIDIELQNSNGTRLVLSENGDTSNEQISRTLSAGTYYLKVYGYQSFNANSCYKLRVTNSAANSVFAATGSELPSGKGDQLKVYPNPAKDQINIHLTIKGEKTSVIKIYDVSGKQILTQNAVNGENTINISRLAAGSYILSAESDSQKLSQKFIKQ